MEDTQHCLPDRIFNYVHRAGLNAWAENLIKGCGNQHYAGRTKLVDCASRCGSIMQVRQPVFEPCVVVTDFTIGIEALLHTYTLRNGTVVHESIQDIKPSGNIEVTFLCLKDKDEKDIPESVWPEEEILEFLLSLSQQTCW